MIIDNYFIHVPAPQQSNLYLDVFSEQEVEHFQWNLAMFDDLKKPPRKRDLLELVKPEKYSNLQPLYECYVDIKKLLPGAYVLLPQ